MLSRILLIFIIAIAITQNASSQSTETFVHEGEFGASVGLAHYYGDLNPNTNFKRPKFAAGVFFTKQFNNYVGAKVAVNYAKVGYSDIYSNNTFQKSRNLSFNSNIWELTLSGSFNFFRFQPQFEEFRFTPYVSLGLGIFTYDPYAYLSDKKYNLRALKTEGKSYGSMAVSIPLAVGLKYALTSKMNIFGEVGYRYTTTDYLDDVSGLYLGADAFPTQANGQPSAAGLLQDRSYELGVTPIGIKGRQRGNSNKNDGYAIVQIGISFNITSYKCPTF